VKICTTYLKNVIKMKEETCVILDFLPNGYPDRRRPEPVAQAIGTSFFTLLELVPREGVELKQEEEVYIGEGKRDKIRFIKGSLTIDDLTNVARSVLPEIVEKLIEKNEKRFINFFNHATTITPRLHQLELLPGIGKKHVVDIIEERNKKPFESFKDLEERVKLFPHPVKTLAKRIMEELEGNEKYYLFVQRPRRPRR